MTHGTRQYPRSTVNGVRKAIHIHVVEKAIGRHLKFPEKVHHVDDNPNNYNNDNLVLCPDDVYHCLLHMRMEAFAACGNYNWRACTYCKKFDDPENMVFVYRKKGPYHYHSSCANAYYVNKMSNKVKRLRDRRAALQ